MLQPFPEKDPYPVEALPTCNYALSVCHGEASCSALFDKFKAACRTRDGDCRMEDRYKKTTKLFYFYPKMKKERIPPTFLGLSRV